MKTCHLRFDEVLLTILMVKLNMLFFVIYQKKKKWISFQFCSYCLIKRTSQIKVIARFFLKNKSRICISVFKKKQKKENEFISDMTQS